jgi:hypothetical protein
MLNLKNLSDEFLNGYIQDLQKGIAQMREDLEYAVSQVNRALEERDRRRAGEGGVDLGYADQED